MQVSGPAGQSLSHYGSEEVLGVSAAQELTRHARTDPVVVTGVMQPHDISMGTFTNGTMETSQD